MSASLFVGGGCGARMELGGTDNPHCDFALQKIKGNFIAIYS